MNETTAIPDIPAHLGKPLQLFTTPRDSKRIAFIVLMALGAILTVFTLLLVFKEGLVVGVPLVLAGFTGLMGFLAFRKTAFTGWHVVVCENGLSSRDYRLTAREDLKRPRDLTWDEIVSLRTSITTFIQGFFSTTYEYYILELPDGDTFDLTSALVGINRLGQLVQEQVYKRIEPRLTDAYRAGQTVSFGPIEISPQGMKVRDEFLPWASVGGVTVRQGAMHIQRAGVGMALAPVPVEEIKNLQVLWMLIGQTIGPKRVG